MRYILCLSLTNLCLDKWFSSIFVVTAKWFVAYEIANCFFRLKGWFISIDCYHSSSSKLTALTSYQIRISWINPNRYSTVKYTLATVIKHVIKTQIIGSSGHFKCTGIEIPIIAVTWDVWQTLHRVFYNLIYMWQAPIIFDPFRYFLLLPEWLEPLPAECHVCIARCARS